MAVKRVIALGTLCAVELNSESNDSGYVSMLESIILSYDLLIRKLLAMLSTIII